MVCRFRQLGEVSGHLVGKAGESRMFGAFGGLGGTLPDNLGPINGNLGPS